MNHFERASDLCPIDHPYRPAVLFNLANAKFIRCQANGTYLDLDISISLFQEALDLRSIGHPDRPITQLHLAIALSSRFAKRGFRTDADAAKEDEPRALDEVISLYHDALGYYTTGHAYRGGLLGNLAILLQTRFKRRGNNKDLDQAITLLREALALRPVGHPDRSISLNNLANKLSTRFEHRGNGEDLDEAITLNTEVLTLRPVGHTYRFMSLNDLAIRFAIRFEHRGNDEDLDEAIALQREGLALFPVGHTDRYKCLHNLANHLSTRFEHFLVMLNDELGLSPSFITIPWTYHQTISRHSLLFSFLRPKSSQIPNVLSPRATQFPYRTQRQPYIVEDWNGTVEEIRKIEGFSRFLLPPLFSDLQDAARGGPIIVLIASESSCHAIIIPHKQPPTSIQLPTDLQKLAKLVPALRKAVGKEAGPKGNQPALIKALRELWDVVVCPVVENLDRFAPRGSRIWWCPTSLFNFLPLHAAGEYRAKGNSLSRHYISSYTPSLTALIKARGSHDRYSSVPFVAIGQDCPAGASFILDAVEPELELVRRLLPPPPTVSFTKITSVDARKSRALCSLRDNTWLHLACHGTQKFDEPFRSAFLMRDQPLSLLDITQTDLSRHEFAFLSACETAVGTFSTPDEVIHLAAGLQFAGVKSVVGTLWKVNDSTVQRLVEAFYKNFCGDGTMNSKRAARALHQAVQSLACDTDMPLDQRIVFVHIGI
ncbi:CHAT domain-containing protein [Suillus bovinus]|uniref:CHAT domain-containing protein n=1 Tax=Suillus bovinus TaxID=48563 RepID=UPI001B873367|nr:CHAT domain-containing protein [Suillus bovinus]KAG2147812.1 CHAT domain-containing protein [Suillus bovinus]